VKKLFQRLKGWYLRRFRGYVAATTSGGTSWQQHSRQDVGFTCRCGAALAFAAADLFVRHRAHVDGCDGIRGEFEGMIACDCPITDARYVKHCPQCRLAHWKDASPRTEHVR
jgi:hypothetical protein